jgi:hypothetical protein
MQPLLKSGYRPSDYYVVRGYHPDRPEAARQRNLAQMKQRRATTLAWPPVKAWFREGGEGGRSHLYQWKKVRGDRKNFPYYSFEYFREAWRQFAPRGKMKLWLAFYGEEPLATLMTIAFGHSTIYKWGSISDTHLELKANYLVHWTAMLWAKEAGCTYYDMGGILPEEAAVFAGGPLPEVVLVWRFKLNFGGQLVASPPAFEYYILRPKWLVRQIAVTYKKRSLRNLVRGIRLQIVVPGP